MMEHGTDPEYELSQGRIALWLSVEDVLWLRDRLAAPEPEQGAEPDDVARARWQRLRSRAALALSKSSSVPMPPLPGGRTDLLFEGVWGKLVPTRLNAETIGLRVVRTGYRFDYLRIEPGDMLLSGNTLPLTSFESFELFVQRLRHERRVELILTRGDRLLRIAGPADDNEPPGAVSVIELGRAQGRE